MGPPGAPFRAGVLPGRGVPGREPYPGQPEFEGPHRSHLPGPPSASRASDWPPRNNGYPARSLRDVPQSSVMNRLGPRVSQDRQKPATEPEFAPAQAPVSSEVAISPALQHRCHTSCLYCCTQTDGVFAVLIAACRFKEAAIISCGCRRRDTIAVTGTVCSQHPTATAKLPLGGIQSCSMHFAE